MKNLKLIFLLLFLFIIMIFSLVKIINWNIDSFNTKRKITQLKKNTKIYETQDNIYTSIISQNDNTHSKFLQIDFNNLQIENNDVIGWIRITGTNVDYPIVQTNNNTYYLSHSFDKSWNNAGWIFLDYRNDINELDINTIIYGHGRFDGTMFGSLKNTLKKEWLNNKDNHVVKISSLSYNYIFEIFSIYKIKTTNDYLYNNFQTHDHYNQFLKKILNRSLYNFKIKPTTKDKIITLSTCYNNTEKFVIHAKLIKQQKRY